MAFALHSIELNNFKSYQGAHSFVFPDEHGLYFFAGLNHVDDLGSNGAGKSTFIDAITWCLYGRTSRGLKANEVVTWGALGCSVLLRLTIGFDSLEIKRTQKPNGLFIGNKPVDQEELEKYIRLNFDSFLHSVLNPQFGQSFFSLAPSAKLTLFSDILGLDFWLEKSDEATNVAKALQIELEGYQRTLDEANGQVKLTQEDVVGLSADEAEFEATKTAKIEEAKLEWDEFGKSISKTAKTLYGLKKIMSGLYQEEFATTDAVQKYESSVDKHLAAINAKLAIKNRLSGELSVFKAQVDKFKALKGVCPHCFQSISKGHATNELHIAQENLATRVRAIDLSEEGIQNVTAALVKGKTAFQAAQSTLRDIKQEIRATEEKIVFARARLTSAQSDQTALTVRTRRLKKEANPYSKLLTEKRATLRELKVAIKQTAEAKDLTEAAHNAASFWIKGFKRVRLFIIEQAFQSLEIEVNNSLAHLGLPDWQITFDIERENKSGNITKGFIVLVKSPRNKEAVRWEAWSGGETQRLQLAGDLGLANLIMTQAGLVNTTEFYDEPSTHLSPEGMVDLANMLHERAISEQKCIWIIDHAAITNFGDFEGVITATKDGHGSAITFTRR